MIKFTRGTHYFSYTDRLIHLDRLNEQFIILDEKISKASEAVADYVGNCMNIQIKKFFKHLQYKFGRDMLYKKGWKYILDQVTHERLFIS